MIIASVDPHYTRLAFSVIRYTEDAGREHITSMYKVVPDLKKKMGNLKSAALACHRTKSIFTISYKFFSEHNPDVIAIEAYAAMPGTSRDSAQKMGTAISAVRCACFALGKFPMEFYAAETRRLILNQAKGKKQDVWEEVFKRYPVRNMPELADSSMEHVYDSLAVAEDALLETLQDVAMRGQGRLDI